jgi:hypothetical protein
MLRTQLLYRLRNLVIKKSIFCDPRRGNEIRITFLGLRLKFRTFTRARFMASSDSNSPRQVIPAIGGVTAERARGCRLNDAESETALVPEFAIFFAFALAETHYRRAGVRWQKPP